MKKFFTSLNRHFHTINSEWKTKLSINLKKKVIFFVGLTIFSFSCELQSQNYMIFSGISDNSTDNKAALDAAFQSCDSLFIPAGSDYYKISGAVTIPSGKTLIFENGAKFNVTAPGNIKGNQTLIIAGEYEIFKNTSVINLTWVTDTIKVAWFGAVGDNVTDDYASIKKFFDFINLTTYSEARFGQNKQYYIKKEIGHQVKKQININGNGSRIYRKYADLSAQESILVLSGYGLYTKIVTSDLAKGQFTMTLSDVTGLSPGMGFTLNSTETFAKEDYGNGVWQIHKKAIMSKIVSIDGNTITMADTIPFNMSKDSLISTSLRFYNVHPVTVKNINFGSENITGTNTMLQFRLYSLFDVDIEDIVFSPLGYSGMTNSRVYNGYFNNISCIAPSSGGDNYKYGVYGIVPTLNINCVYNNIYGRAVTHGIAFSAFDNGPCNKTIVKNSDFKATNNGSASVDSHASQWVKLVNCTIWGAQAVCGTLIFDSCEMREAVNGTTIFNERLGGSRGGLKAYFTNCNFYTKPNGATNSTLFWRWGTDNAETNLYSVKNNKFYLENAQTYITCGNAATATDFQPFIVDNNEFYGTGTLYIGRIWNANSTAQGGTYTFANNKYSKINFHSPPSDQFATINIINNIPVSESTSDFLVSWDNKTGNVNFINNVFVGKCFWIKGCTGNINFENNNIYNNIPIPAVSYKNRNYLTSNTNLSFTGNELNATYWTLTGNLNVSGNTYNGIAQPNIPSGNWENINTPGSSVETGVTMEGVVNYTIISRAKMDDITSNAVQNLVGSSVTKLSYGFNPSSATPVSKPTIRNIEGTIDRPVLSKFYMDQEWHTYIFMMENGILKAYMDGIGMLSYDASSVYHQMYADGTIQIGGINSTELWDGPIQSFAIYNRALSLEEANSFSENPNLVLSGELYRLVNADNSETITEPKATNASNVQQTSFTANWNVSTGATGYYLDVATNSNFTSFVSGYNNKDVGNTTSSSIIGLTAGNTYYYRLRAFNVSGTSGNSNTISVTTSEAVLNNLIAYWGFEENNGTVAIDSSGNNYHGTLVNGPIWICGVKENALQFDGFNDRVECGTNSGLDMGTEDFTIAAWVKMGSSQVSYPTIVSKGGSSNRTAGYWFYFYNNSLKFVFGDGVSRISASSNPVAITDNLWHHIALTIDRDGNAVFYVDGANSGTRDITSFNNKDISNAERSFTIGSLGVSSTTYIKGSMDDVRIYKRALVDSEISTLSIPPPQTSGNLIAHWAFDENNGTVAIDSSTNCNSGNLLNGTAWSPGVKGSALSFDGLNDRVDCGNSSGLDMSTGDMSISVWVKLSETQVAYPTIISKGATSDATPGYWFYITNTNIRVVLGDGTNRLAYSSNSVNIYDDIWHHIAITLDRDGRALFYLDGINIGSVSITSFNGKNISNASIPLNIGSTSASSTNVYGTLDDLYIFNTVLSAESIDSLANFQNCDIAMVLHFDENSGNIAYDSTAYSNDGILENGTSWNGGISGSSVQFDGRNDKINCGNAQELEMSTDDITIATWVNMVPSQASYSTIFSKGGYASTNAGYWLYLRNSALHFSVSDGTNQYLFNSDDIYITDNTWHHIAITIKRDSSLTFYIDGATAGSYDATFFQGLNFTNTDESLIIGSADYRPTYFKGKIDEFRVYKCALTETEISDLAFVPQQNMVLLDISDNYPKTENNNLNVYPNPFITSVIIAFSLEEEENIQANIYAFNGNKIKTLQDGVINKGENMLTWDGLDNLDREVPKGLYVVQIISDSKVSNKTIVKMR